MSLLCSKPWWALHFTKSRSQSASNGVQDPISVPLSFFTTLISPPATICLPPSVWATLASCFLNTLRCSCLGGHSFYLESSSPWYICKAVFLILKSMLKSHLFHVAYPKPIPMLLVSLAYLPFMLYSPHPPYCDNWKCLHRLPNIPARQNHPRLTATTSGKFLNSSSM